MLGERLLLKCALLLPGLSILQGLLWLPGPSSSSCSLEMMDKHLCEGWPLSWLLLIIWQSEIILHLTDYTKLPLWQRYYLDHFCGKCCLPCLVFPRPLSFRDDAIRTEILTWKHPALVFRTASHSSCILSLPHSNCFCWVLRTAPFPFLNRSLTIILFPGY